MGKVLRKRRRVWRADGHVRGIVVSRRRPRGRAKSRGERNPFDFACHLVERSLSTSGKTTVFPAFHRAEFTKPVDSFRLEFGRGKVKGWWTPAFTRNARRRLLVEISISIIELRGSFSDKLGRVAAKFPQFFLSSFVINLYIVQFSRRSERNQRLNYIFAEGTRRGVNPNRRRNRQRVRRGWRLSQPYSCLSSKLFSSFSLLYD